MPDSEYILCTFIDELEQEEIFTEWPLHVTLVPWFSSSDIDSFHDQLIDRLKQIPEIAMVVSNEKVWGPNTVNVLEFSKELQTLHELILGVVLGTGKILVNQQFTDKNYTPHITHQKSSSANVADTIFIKDVYIIERDSKTKVKTVLHKIKLRGDTL